MTVSSFEESSSLSKITEIRYLFLQIALSYSSMEITKLKNSRGTIGGKCRIYLPSVYLGIIQTLRNAVFGENLPPLPPCNGP